MFDVSSRITYSHVPKWYNDLTRVSENNKIVLIASKVDIEDRKVKTKQIIFHKKHNIELIEISAKLNYQID